MPHAITRSSAEPFARKRYWHFDAHRLAYSDEGEGPATVFLHGNPTSSYLWRNVMPHLVGHGRLIAPVLAGYGDSDKIDPSFGPDRYGFLEQRRRLDALLEHLVLGDEVVLVLHDFGSMLGFDWARRNARRVKGIVHMEAVLAPLVLADFPDAAREALFRTLATPEAREASLQALDLLEGFVFGTREFSQVEKAHHLKPFVIPGEDRRPTVSSEVPVEGVPPVTAGIVAEYARWMSRNDIPKLMIKAEPGFLVSDRVYDMARTWPNQQETRLPGGHYLQETAPDAIGRAIASFVDALRR